MNLSVKHLFLRQITGCRSPYLTYSQTSSVNILMCSLKKFYGSFFWANKRNTGLEVHRSSFSEFLSTPVIVSGIHLANGVYVEQKRILVKNIYIKITLCSFVRCFSIGKGGAILIENTDIDVTFTKASFVDCYAFKAGAFSVESSILIANQCCIDRTSCSYLFPSFIYSSDLNSNSECVMNNTIIFGCGKNVERIGNILIIHANESTCDSDNHTHNYCKYGSVLYRSVNNGKSLIQFCSFEKNNGSFGMINSYHCSLLYKNAIFRSNKIEFILFLNTRFYESTILIFSGCTFQNNTSTSKFTKTKNKQYLMVLESCYMEDDINDLINLNDSILQKKSTIPFPIELIHEYQYCFSELPIKESIKSEMLNTIIYIFLSLIFLLGSIYLIIYKYKNSQIISWMSNPGDKLLSND